MPSRAVRAEPLNAPIDPLFEEFAQGTEGRKASTTMVFVRILSKLLRDKEIGDLIVPIVPDEARTFGMEALFRQVGIYSHIGQKVRTGRHGHAALLQGSAGRADSRGRHHRSGLDVVVHRRRHRLRHARHQHHSLLHLLLDVRLPARRRFDLGRRRFAHARIPAGGHGRPDDARRRRVAAPGRPQPRVLAVGAQLHVLRPGIRLRAGRHHPGRHSPDVQEPGEHLLLPDRDERAVRDAADAGGRERGHPQGPLSVQHRGQRQGQAEGAAARQRRDPQRGHCRTEAAREIRRGGGCVERHELSGALPRRATRASAGTCCTPPTRRACRT